ncbi:MAG: sulfatase-like hydrolase/transferase [Hyphomicrobiales bacterium]|nr:sulfatase-like hydrolase/transferase [Hyphomicrobiales bacterium]
MSHADYSIGRLLDAIQQSGQLENTLVIFIMGDNGASPEGSLQGGDVKDFVSGREGLGFPAFCFHG